MTEPVPFKSDADMARELRDKVHALLIQVCAEMDAASPRGLIVGFHIDRDKFGRNVPHIEVVKPLA